ncbi:hypothetical protein APY03_5029 [Variovorax sp. WDL1]|nr:hypothetical protein APY03_5029 [Variovorax sp. WDL1]
MRWRIIWYCGRCGAFWKADVVRWLTYAKPDSICETRPAHPAA